MEHGEVLFELASGVSGVCVEIGSWAGRSSAILGNALKQTGGKLYCIDHWNKIQEAVVDTSVDIWTFWNHVIEKFGLKDTVFPIRGLSVEIASQWPSGKLIDLLFIDGYHPYREEGDFILTQEMIDRYKIRGWQKNGRLIPTQDYTPSFARGVKVDFDAWTPKLKVGGYLVMHDVNCPEHPGVDRVWNEDVKSSGNWRVLYESKGIGVAFREA